MNRYKLFDEMLSVMFQATELKMSSNVEMRESDACLDVITISSYEGLALDDFYKLIDQLAHSLIPDRINNCRFQLTQPNWNNELKSFSIVQIKSPAEVARDQLEQERPDLPRLPCYQVIDFRNPEIPRCKGAPCYSLEEAQQVMGDVTDPQDNPNRIFELLPID